MIPWELIDTAPVPGAATEMSLHRRGHVFSIRVDGVELMNNMVYDIECPLAHEGCAALADRDDARVLIGGLGMGFTLAQTLRQLGPASRVVCAELVPAVVRWNRTVLAGLSDDCLADPRVSVVERDVGALIRQRSGAYDAILLDVDNGPEGLSRKSNDSLYAPAGLEAARRALRPRGVLAVWSHSGDRAFVARLQRAGFAVEERRSRRRGQARQTVFVARPGRPTPPAPRRRRD